MKKIFNHALLCAVLLFLFLPAKQRTPVLAGVILTAFCIMRTHDRTFLLLLVLLCLTFVPGWKKDRPSVQIARVTAVSASSLTAEADGYRFQVFCDEEIAPDSEIAFTGTFRRLSASSHFFGMDFAAWNQSRGIYYSIHPKTLTVVKVRHTFRSFLYHRVMKIQDPKLKSISFKVLLGINDPEEDSFFYRCGFSLSGILTLMEKILEKHVNEKRRGRILSGTALVLFIVYRFPLILFQYLVFRVLKKCPLRKDERIGIGLIVMMLVYPESIYSAAFLLPACFRLASLERKNRRAKGFYFSCLVQSYLFQGFNPAVSLLFSLYRPLLGAGWFLALFSVGIGFHEPLYALQWADALLTLSDRLFLPGSIMGIGLLFYLGILWCSRRSEHLLRSALIWLFVFQIGGFFHPFGEVSFLNVGQGDSIFIKAPLSHEAVLIDTGKPSQYRTVTAYLKAKGIRKLDTMVITHGDDDHSGCKDRLAALYHPDQLIETHRTEITSQLFTFYDLNEIENEDENQSSIVLYTKINGMKLLLMGDADKVTEKKIAEKYGLLSCDVLKLSHHGSKTGSSDVFLDTVRPSLAVISAGAYQMYHHPSPETIQRLLKRHIPYLNTKNEGDIAILCLPHMNLCMTAEGRLGIITTDE